MRKTAVEVGDRCRWGTGWGANNTPNPLVSGVVIETKGRFCYVKADGSGAVVFAVGYGLLHPTEARYLIEERV